MKSYPRHTKTRTEFASVILPLSWRCQKHWKRAKPFHLCILIYQYLNHSSVFWGSPVMMVMFFIVSSLKWWYIVPIFAHQTTGMSCSTGCGLQFRHKRGQKLYWAIEHKRLWINTSLRHDRCDVLVSVWTFRLCSVTGGIVLGWSMWVLNWHINLTSPSEFSLVLLVIWLGLIIVCIVLVLCLV